VNEDLARRVALEIIRLNEEIERLHKDRKLLIDSIQRWKRKAYQYKKEVESLKGKK
jgi:phage shock protein A